MVEVILSVRISRLYPILAVKLGHKMIVDFVNAKTFILPREWIERGYNVAQWSYFPVGGHFAAMEEPELLADDIRSFFTTLRRG